MIWPLSILMSSEAEGAGMHGGMHKGILKIAVYALIWYSSSVLAVVTSKQVLSLLPFPITLCLFQFQTAAALLSVVSKYFFEAADDCSQDNITASVTKRKIALSYTFGFILTNFAYQIVAPSFVESVKAAEPISSALLSFLMLGQINSCRTYATLVPVCLGVALACQGKHVFSLIGLIASLCANMCFSARSVYSRQFYALSHATPVSGLSLFCDISWMGLLILYPLSFLFDWTSISTLIFNWKYSELQQMPLNILLNCLAYTTYNCMSFLILAETNALSHSVLNALRRISTIGFTIFYFDVSVSLMNEIGVICTVLGALLYAVSIA